MKRPVPIYAGTVELAANVWSYLSLGAGVGASPLAAGDNSIRGFMNQTFSMYKGDTVYDVIFRSPTPGGVHIYAFCTNSYPGAQNDTSGTALAAYLPNNGSVVWPSSAGATSPTPQMVPTIDCKPVTTTIAPGHLRIVQPFRNQQRAAPTNQNYTAGLYNDGSENDTYLAFFSETLVTVDFTIWKQIGDSFSFGTFAGLPLIYLDALTVAGTPGHQYSMPDSYFPGATLRK
jgi:hypothetical protein